MGKWLRSRIVTGDPILMGTRRLVFQTHAIQVTLPFFKGGLVWNRPFSVLVQDGDQPERKHALIDMTRVIQLLILASGMLVALWIRRNPR